MNKPAERPFGRMLGIAVVAVLVALVAAVSAFAVGGSTTTADNPASSPAQTQPVQDSEATPEQGSGGREDCPEKHGEGQGDGAGQGGSQQEGQSTAPDAGTPAPEV
jgi:hypothetical protein